MVVRRSVATGAHHVEYADMSHTNTSRPHMGATYAPGTVRTRRWHGDGDVVGPEIFISTVIRAFHAAKSHSFRTPRLSFKRSPGRRAAKASQNRRGIVPFARRKKIALRKGTPFLAIMRSSHLML